MFTIYNIRHQHKRSSFDAAGQWMSSITRVQQAMTKNFIITSNNVSNTQKKI